MSADFQAILQALVDQVPGSRAAIMADGDGITVAAAGHDPKLEMDVLVARYAVVLQDLRVALDRLGHGELSQLLLDLRAARIAVIPFRDRFALYLILEPGQDVGRALFEARKASAALDAAI